MITLGLDISSVSTGWAIMHDGELTSYGKITFPKKMKHGQKLSKFSSELTKIFNNYVIDEVKIEACFQGINKKVFGILSQYHGCARAVVWDCIEEECKYHTVSQIRKQIAKYFDTRLPKKDAKIDVFHLINEYFSLNLKFESGNDITDAIAVAMA